MSETNPTPRVENTIDGDIDPGADLTQVGDIGEPDGSEQSSVRNTVSGRVSGGAKIIQAGNLTGDIHL